VPGGISHLKGYLLKNDLAKELMLTCEDIVWQIHFSSRTILDRELELPSRNDRSDHYVSRTTVTGFETDGIGWIGFIADLEFYRDGPFGQHQLDDTLENLSIVVSDRGAYLVLSGFIMEIKHGAANPRRIPLKVVPGKERPQADLPHRFVQIDPQNIVHETQNVHATCPTGFHRPTADLVWAVAAQTVRPPPD
jgi:hypothetical protein